MDRRCCLRQIRNEGGKGGQAGTPQGRFVDEIRKGVMVFFLGPLTGLDDLHSYTRYLERVLVAPFPGRARRKTVCTMYSSYINGVFSGNGKRET